LQAVYAAIFAELFIEARDRTKENDSIDIIKICRPCGTL
jgi:hypothetical protein